MTPTSSDVPVPLTQRRRKPRLAEKELRDAMYHAAQRLVYEMGVAVSLEDLGFEDVIRIAGVPRSSAYRVWPYKGDFVADLLTHLAGPKWLGASVFDRDTVEVSYRTIEAHADLLHDPAGRRAVLQETVRLAVAQNFKSIVEANEWHIYVALIATVRTTRDEDSRRRITAALAASEVAFVHAMTGFYRKIFGMLGIRLRQPGCSLEQLATAGAAVVEGLALRKVLVDSARALPPDRLTNEQRQDINTLRANTDTAISGPSLDGGTTDWSLAAIAFLGILDALCEPDPNYDPRQPANNDRGRAPSVNGG